MKRAAVPKSEMSNLFVEKATEPLQPSPTSAAHTEITQTFYEHSHYLYQNIKQGKIHKSSCFHHTFLSAYFGSSGRTIIIFPSGYSAKILSFFQP